LTLNTSKTEFILIRLKQQLAKLTPANLTQYTLLLILASFFMNILLFQIRYLLFLKPAILTVTYTSTSLHSSMISWSQIAKPTPLHPSFSVSLTTATHFTMVCPNIR